MITSTIPITWITTAPNHALIYGGHIAVRAVASGLKVKGLVLLSTPFYDADSPNVVLVKSRCKVVAFRTEDDLVLFADSIVIFFKHPLGGKFIKPPFPEIRIGLLKFTAHSATHDREVWQKYQLAKNL